MRYFCLFSSESEATKPGTGVQRSQSCLEIKLPKSGKNKDESEPVNSSNVLESKTSTHDKVKDNQVDFKTVARSQSVIETKTDTYEGTGKGLSNGVKPSVKKQVVDETKVHEVGQADSNTSQTDIINKNEIINGVIPTVKRHREDGRKLDRVKSGISRINTEVGDHDSKSRSSVEITKNRNQEVLANGPIVVNEHLNVQQSSALNKEIDNSPEKEHSSHSHSKTKHSILRHSTGHSKSHSPSKTSSADTTKTDISPSKSKPLNTQANKSVLERKRYSVGEYEQSVSKTDSSEKSYVKQRKHSLESLADSYRLRDQEDKHNRQFNSTLLKDVIGKLEDRISKSIEDKKISKPNISKTLEDRPSKPPSKILISRANSESSLLKRVKESDNKSKDKAVKQLKDTEKLSKVQNKVNNSKEVPKNEVGKTVVNRLENHNSSKDSNLGATPKEKNSERLSPSIPWLEEKKKSSPTPSELDKLMSTMDIENAFSQILDAVEQCPGSTDTSEPPTPDTPIVPIAEEEHSCESGASGLESGNEEVDENKNVYEKESKSDVEHVPCENHDTGNMTLKQTEMADEAPVTKDSENTEAVDSNKNLSNSTAETNSAIKSNSGITKKSEGRLNIVFYR